MSEEKSPCCGAGIGWDVIMNETGALMHEVCTNCGKRIRDSYQTAPSVVITDEER